MLNLRVLLTLCGLFGSALAAHGGELMVGAAAVRISPPAGAPMAGYYYLRVAEGVHDDLFARAIVIDVEGSRAAIVACDLVHLPAAIVDQARTLAFQRTGIPVDHIMVSATHTHTGPTLTGTGFRSNFEGEARRIAEKYTSELPVRIAESIERATLALAPARVSAARAEEASVAFNRRYFMRDGTVGWNPGKKNPQIVRPAGPIDPDVPFVLFSSLEGKPRALYVSHAMHPDTTGGTEFSADYPYTLGRLLAGAKGTDLVTLFAIGCAGNVNHVDVSSAEKQSGPDEAARIGTILAGDVLKAWKSLAPIADPVLYFGSERVALQPAAIERADVPWARQIAASYGPKDAAPFMDLVKAQKILDVDARNGQPFEAEVQVIALGADLAWVGLPGEIFTELGMAIKQSSPFRFTIVAELANGNLGYIPNRKAYAEGAYEPVSARVAEGSGERLVDAATRQLIRLHGLVRASAPRKESGRAQP